MKPKIFLNILCWRKSSRILKKIIIRKIMKFFLSSCNDESRCDPSRVQELEVQLEKVMEKIYLIAAEVKVLEKVMEGIDLMAGEVKNIKHSSQRGAGSSALSSSSTAPPIHEGAVVGFEDYVKDVKDRLCREKSRLQVIPICGMGGIGKTTLARKAYEDPLIMEEFVIRVWVTISQDYSVERIVSNILESLKEFNTGISGSNDGERVRKILMLRRYLIVMDDMWSSEVWDALKWVFPDVVNGSCILITTRLFDVASYPDPSSKLCEMQLMDADQSWSLLKQKVLLTDNDSPELEIIGKEIARSCKGLPLAIAVIAGLLSTVGKNPASWMEIAKKVKSAAQEKIEDILSLSYTHLPQYLRPCFMYMGSFPEDEEINASRLIRLWVAEGFVKHPNANRCESLEEEAQECLEDLVKRNLVMVKKWKWDGRIKSCSLHDMMRELSIRRAHESKFLLSFMDRVVKKGHFIERVKNERRVSIDSSSLQFLSSIRDSAIHTIMCSRYRFRKLKFVKNVRLLRVLDAVDVVEAESPPDQIFHLRYLAICYYSNTPVALPNLQNLQTLIIYGEWSISRNLRLHWCMPQLRHVSFDGTIHFDDPKESDSSLENLRTVSYMSHVSCTKRILNMLPSLKKLKIAYYSDRRGDSTFMDDLVHLEQLESLEIRADPRVELRPKLSYLVKLKRLCLRGLRFPWDDMNITVGSLPHLQLLKLRSCYCVGSSTWETMEGQFPQLEFLVIEKSLGFENWITESSHFPRLKRLVLDHCWYLKRIPNDIGEIPTLEVIDVKGILKESLLKSAKEIKKEQEDLGNITLVILIKGQRITQR